MTRQHISGDPHGVHMKTEITDKPSKTDVNALLDGLNEYNYSIVPRDYRTVAVFVREKGRLIGGAYGASVWDWIHLKYLWVHPAHRETGVGSHMIKELEREAERRGVIGIHLDTFSFQAVPFYEKNGFEIFGVVENHSRGHRRYYLKKVIETNKELKAAGKPAP